MVRVSENPFALRLDSLRKKALKRKLDVILISGEANVRALTGIVCDNAELVLEMYPKRGTGVVLYTDFRYIPMVHRMAPWLKVRDFRYFVLGSWKRVGYEGSIPASEYLDFVKKLPKACFVDVKNDLLLLRAVKTPTEIAKIAAAEALNDRIWNQVQREIAPGMTEKDIQRVIRAWMNALGDGEAFETIVCVGANAAECHHIPDDTVWNEGAPLLVDMGVKLDGVCADMTRCLRPKLGVDPEYDKVYEAVLSANSAAIAACKPGMTGRELDAVARRLLKKLGYGKAFGHSLGHGVGYEIHEWPVASVRSKTKLQPGMCVTIEPGVYLEGRLGVRIEDLVLVTSEGCEVLSSSAR